MSPGLLRGNQLQKPADDHERIIPHSFLRNLYGKAVEFNETDTPEKAAYLASQIAIASDVLSEVDGVDAVFGLGYPFYGFYHNGVWQGVPPVPEITRFIQEKAALVELDAQKNLGAWACAACQTLNELPDLKTVCRPCDLAILKPREPFKAMLDLDFWVVVEKMRPDLLQNISEELFLAGFSQSDADVFHSLMATNNAFDLVLGAELGEDIRGHDHNLPVDVHVLDRRTFLEAVSGVASNPTARVDVHPQSLRMGWVENPDPIDFGFDFMFSLTGSSIKSPKLIRAIKDSRQEVSAWLDRNGKQASNLVSARNERAARILESPVHRIILDARMHGWTENPFSDMEELTA